MKIPRLWLLWFGLFAGVSVILWWILPEAEEIGKAVPSEITTPSPTKLDIPVEPESPLEDIQLEVLRSDWEVYPFGERWIVKYDFRAVWQILPDRPLVQPTFELRLKDPADKLVYQTSIQEHCPAGMLEAKKVEVAIDWQWKDTLDVPIQVAKLAMKVDEAFTKPAPPAALHPDSEVEINWPNGQASSINLSLQLRGLFQGIQPEGRDLSLVIDNQSQVPIESLQVNIELIGEDGGVLTQWKEWLIGEQEAALGVRRRRIHNTPLPVAAEGIDGNDIFLIRFHVLSIDY
ncbi:MAG: hypothetical protein AAFQ68_06740 [Bacteroidota bacterium]